MFNLFKPKIKEEPRPDLASDKLIQSVLDLINQENLIKSFFDEYYERLGSEPWPGPYAQLYLALEKFVVENRPPVVKGTYTTQGLREMLFKKVGEKEMPAIIRPIFYPADRKIKVVFEESLVSLQDFLRQDLGDRRYDELLTSIGGFDKATLGLGEIAEVKAKYRTVLGKIYLKLNEIYGQKRANEIYGGLYERVKVVHDYETLSLFLDVLPSGILSEERFAVLSKQELEQEIKVRTLEVNRAKEQLEKRVKEAEGQNKLLEDTKKAVLNILEDEKELEETITSERDRVEAIVASVGEGLIVMGKDRKVQMMNDNARKMLELKADEGIGVLVETIAKLYRGDKELKVYERPSTMTLELGRQLSFGLADNIFLSGKSGKKIPISVDTNPLTKNKEVEGVVIVFRDITADKQVKEEIEREVYLRTNDLNQEKAKLKAAIDNLKRGLILVDAKEEILLMNPLLLEVLDLKAEPKSFVEIEKLLKVDDGYDLHELETKVKKTGKSLDVEMEYQAKFLDISISPIFLAEGKGYLGSLITIGDITEQKVLERSRDEFFSIASHELRTPLTAIRGNIALIRDLWAPKIEDVETKEMINDIHEASVRLIAIVNDFLNLSRLEQKRMEFKISKFELGDLIDKVVEEVGELLNEKKLKLNWKRDGEVTVEADIEKIREVLINLVGNAIKYTEKGTVDIKVYTENSHAVVDVADTGRGIPLKNQTLLFRKFQQAGGSLFTRDTTKGTGLGLYISKLIMEGLKGKIALRSSKEGVGSVFYIEVPLAKK